MTRRLATNTALVEAYAAETQSRLRASGLGTVKATSERRNACLVIERDGDNLLSVTFKIRRRTCGLEFITATILREGDVYCNGHVEHEGCVVTGRLFVLNTHPLYDQKIGLFAALETALSGLALTDQDCERQAEIDQVKADLSADPEVACEVIEHLMAARPDIVPEVTAAVAVVQERRGLIQRMFARPSFMHA